MIDTHSHIYDSAFDEDRFDAVQRALDAGVSQILMPAIDSTNHDILIRTATQFAGVCLSMMGLHPTSVNENPNYRNELDLVAKILDNPPVERFYAIGEVGLDLHWSGDYLPQQREALLFQIELALKYHLPLVVHCRDAWAELFAAVEPYKGFGLRGVMHAFSGDRDIYMQVRELGDFMIGIAGPVTYKKNHLAELLLSVPLEHIVLETDSPYLPPTPHRGKRNESSYIPIICGAVAQIKGLTLDEVDLQTTLNAERIFSL